MSNRSAKISPEWSYLIPSEDIDRNPRHFRIKAGVEERAAVARRLGVVSIEKLEAELAAERNPGTHVIHVSGRLHAELTQECVVTLEPVGSAVDGDFEGWLSDIANTVSFTRARNDRLKTKGGVDIPVLDEREDPEPATEGMIDLGELTVQHLSLSVPAYPHKEGVGYEPPDDGCGASVEIPDSRKNPFAGLKDWKAGGEQD